MKWYLIIITRWGREINNFLKGEGRVMEDKVWEGGRREFEEGTGPHQWLQGRDLQPQESGRASQLWIYCAVPICLDIITNLLHIDSFRGKTQLIVHILEVLYMRTEGFFQGFLIQFWGCVKYTCTLLYTRLNHNLISTDKIKQNVDWQKMANDLHSLVFVEELQWNALLNIFVSLSTTFLFL